MNGQNCPFAKMDFLIFILVVKFLFLGCHLNLFYIKLLNLQIQRRLQAKSIQSFQAHSWFIPGEDFLQQPIDSN